MIQVRHTIVMKGGAQVELLATPALFAIAKRKGMVIEADSDNMSEVYAAYNKLIYLSALNAWEVRRFDLPEMGECPYKLMDFVEWSANDGDAFVKAVNFVLAALTGKELKDYATGEAQDSETGEKSPKTQGEGAPVKKKVHIELDYASIQAFLVGRCGKTVKESALTSKEEYDLLVEGHNAREKEEWERLRWRVYMDWTISPNLKRRPHTPQDVVRFPWEREPAEVKDAEPLTENEIQGLCRIFKITRDKVTN